MKRLLVAETTVKNKHLRSPIFIAQFFLLVTARLRLVIMFALKVLTNLSAGFQTLPATSSEVVHLPSLTGKCASFFVGGNNKGLDQHSSTGNV